MDNLCTLSFVFPEAILLLPLPWIIQRFFQTQPQDSIKAVYAPTLIYFFETAELSCDLLKYKKPANRWSFFILWISLLLLMMQPVIVCKKKEVNTFNQYLIILDLSKSMLSEDVRSLSEIDKAHYETRLNTAKQHIHQLLKKNQSSHFGLIVFGEFTHMIVPLTDDHVSLKNILDILQTGIAGEKSALGDAIAYSIATLKSHQELSKNHSSSYGVVIYSDGDNSPGSLPLSYAAKQAQDANIKLHAVQLGIQGDSNTSSETISLKQSAQQTGGFYLNINNLNNFNDLPLKPKNKLDKQYNHTITKRDHLITIVLYLLLTGSFLLWSFRREAY